MLYWYSSIATTLTMMKLLTQLLHTAKATPLARYDDVCTSPGNTHATGPKEIP